MSGENFTVEILRAPSQNINRAEWKGGNGHIRGCNAFLAPKAFFALSTADDFKGRVLLKGDLEHYEKDGRKWTYRWSQQAEEKRVGFATLTLRYDDEATPDVVVTVQMREVSDLIIEALQLPSTDSAAAPPVSQEPFLTLRQVATAAGIGAFVAIVLLMLI